jgi:PAS domain S-box-containing protein
LPRDKTGRKLETDDRQKLRAEAEARFARDSRHGGSGPPTSELLHELQVHQIELEMQNEELRRSQLELEEAHDRQVDLYDFAPIGYITLDGNGVIISANLTAATLLGVERGTLLGRPFPGLVTREDGDRWHLAFVALLQGGEKAVHRLTLRRGGRATFDADVVCEHRSGRDGNRVGIVLTDVTEFARIERDLRQADAALRERELRFRTMANGAPVLIWVAGTDKLCNWFNEPWLAFTGRTMSQEMGSGWAEGVHPDDLKRCMDIYAGHFDRRKPFSMEYRLRRHDGAHRWIVDNGKPMFDPKGNFTGYIGSCMDIDDARRAGEAVAASEAKYRGLFDSLMDGFVVVDMDGVVRESNEVYRKMLGYSAEDLEHATYMDLTPERWHPVEARIVAEQVLPRGYSEIYEKEYRRKDGTIFPVELRTFLMKEGGRPVAMWAIIRDVTEARALRMKLAIAGRMAALGTLVSGVAHEINNPLAAEMADQGIALEVVREVRERMRSGSPVDGMAEGRALDGVVEALEDAQDGAARIARIVKDLTVFGRPDATRQRSRLMDILEGAMRWLPATVARSAAIRVENGGAPDVNASAGQIEQILVNLITNAARAMPEGQRGTVIVRVGPGLPGRARVEVIDHGIGIDPAIREHVFDPFFTTRPTGSGRGSGLGLAICQAIATAHGGTLTFESEVGKGSTFRLELPVVTAET